MSCGMRPRETEPAAVLLYTVWPDEASCLAVAEDLVAKGEVACVNLLGPVTSVYAWQGRIERGQEIAALFKTRGPLARSVCAAIAARHPYEVPAILALDVRQEGSFAPYLDWVAGQTGRSTPE